MRIEKRKKPRIVGEEKQRSFATRKLHSIGVKKVNGKDVNYLRYRHIASIYKKHFKKELESDYLKWVYDKKFCNDNDKIYFIGNIDYGFVKIGYSKNPNKRLGGIQTGCPFPLTILRIESGTTDHEKMYHNKFHRLNTFGEWFKIEGELKAYLGLGETNKTATKNNTNDLDSEFNAMFSRWGGLIAS